MKITMYDADGNELGDLEGRNIHFETESAPGVPVDYTVWMKPVTVSVKMQPGDFEGISGWFLSMSRRQEQKRLLARLLRSGLN
jgi:hypothetical protein